MNDIVTKEDSDGPKGLIQRAIESGASIEQLERLMDMQERWEANEARKQYVSAMNAFRSKCPVIEKTRKGHNSKYAGLAETIEQIKQLLAECGLSHSWKTDQGSEGYVSVQCCVTHIAGHKECASMTAPPDDSGKKNPIQAIASSISYLQRYTLFAILGLASAEIDDDGDMAYAKKEYVNDEQIANIESLADEVGANIHAMCSYFGVKHIGVIPAKSYDAVIKALEKKRNQ